MYVHMYMHTHMCIYIYIYIYAKGEDQDPSSFARFHSALAALLKTFIKRGAVVYVLKC